MTKNSFITLSLKIYPKLLVVLIGILVFMLSENFLGGNVQSLAINISATLISIPIIFIAYEIWNEKSQKKLNESVYSYVQNEMSVTLIDIREKMRFFIDGAFVYFEDGDIIIDDSDIENLKLKMDENSKIIDDEDGDPYQKKYQLEGLDDNTDESESDIYSYEKDTIVEVMNDGRYLGYQLVDLEISTNLERLDTLLNNSFIMERLDDTKTQIIIHLIEAMKMLDTFIEAHEDLFLSTSIKIKGFDIKKEEHYIYNLYYIEKKKKKTQYKQLLDSKFLDQDIDKTSLLAVYIINPDYYAIFGDLVQEVLSCIKDWKKNDGGVYVDYASAKIGVL